MDNPSDFYQAPEKQTKQLLRVEGLEHGAWLVMHYLMWYLPTNVPENPVTAIRGAPATNIVRVVMGQAKLSRAKFLVPCQYPHDAEKETISNKSASEIRLSTARLPIIAPRIFCRMVAVEQTIKAMYEVLPDPVPSVIAVAMH